MTDHNIDDKSAKTDPLWEWFIANAPNAIDVKYTQPTRYDWVCEPDTPLSSSLVCGIKYHPGIRQLATCGTATELAVAYEHTPHGKIEFTKYESGVELPRNSSVDREQGWNGGNLDELLKTLATDLAGKMEVDFVKDLADVGTLELAVHYANAESSLAKALNALPISISRPSFAMHPRTWVEIRRDLLWKRSTLVEDLAGLERQLYGCDVFFSDAFAPSSGGTAVSLV